ncbi:MAG TPA: DNA polymerase ligase N-terminal domain-containing protein [Acidimicrobiales bacterium]|nr:DNA polymerase ligase N-terminal domain-containing protein [Acidimicrobiales bacterium]
MAVAQKRGKALREYKAKRDFGVTPEPSGEARRPRKGPLRFVVQRHRARATHYDFRLEVNGVLASWAIPKGPTLDPTVRNLAVHVEDHPIEYMDFEGIIPRGEYGGGDVIVWDKGTYKPVGTDDPAKAIAAGELHVDLNGKKLRGRFVLIRTRADRVGREQWLILHKHDEFAVKGWKPDDYPRSVKSGRTNEEVAADPDAEWHSDRPASDAEVRTRRRTGRTKEKVDTPRPEGTTKEEIDALEALGDKGNWEVGGRTINLTNLDKELFPRRGREKALTKRDLIRYYVTMAPFLVPYLTDRPVNLHRFPNGVQSQGFWQKQIPKYAPDWLRRWRNPSAGAGETTLYAVVENAAGLAWMANFGAVELHAWTSRIPRVREPTWALIDIDPGESTSFKEVLVLARLYRTALEHLGVLGMPKLTGQRGIHVWIPLVPGYSFEDTRNWVEKLSRAVGSMTPDLVSWSWDKQSRHGLARLDYTQNAINKTLVVPYGVRPAPGGPVSVPIEWDELDERGLRSDKWTMSTVPGRVAQRGDLYARLLDNPQKLPKI